MHVARTYDYSDWRQLYPPSTRDLVLVTVNGARELQPRVLISKAARSRFHDSHSFCMTRASKNCCNNDLKLPYRVELLWQVIVMLSVIVPGQLGLFAAVFIPRGAYVVQYHGEYFLEGAPNCPEDKGSRRHYGWNLQYLDPDTQLLLDAYTLRNEAAYVNHACDANMEKVIICKDVEGTLPGLVFRAIRDIEVGEELTIPYYYADDFDESRDIPVLQCRCGADGCLGVVFWDTPDDNSIA